MGNSCAGSSTTQTTQKTSQTKKLVKSQPHFQTMNSYTADYDYLGKVLLIGDSGVGKSSILLRFTDNTYSGSFISTIGVDFKIKTLERSNKVYKLHIWDTAGQERFRTITSCYYRGSQAVIIVFDVCDKESWRNVNRWLHEVDKYTTENVVKIIVGNKTDKEEDRVVTTEEAKEFSYSRGLEYFETSAKNDKNVTDMFWATTLAMGQRQDALSRV
mmetsp:Transcript_28908/g.32117  ORF Transcript_28908/g.32117 Transcript_28908/m.32117 type:complete len:215 (+) Transcript_28908:32-676(+)